MGSSKANAKLQRHQSQAALAGFALGVKGFNSLATLEVVGFFFDLVNHLVTHPVFDQLVVLGGHGVRRSTDSGILVEVDFANIQGIFAQSGGNFVHHGFDTKHTLRPTKTTESSSALRVGFAAVADQLQSGDVIDVINVQTSAVIDWARVVRAVTATRHKGDVCAQDTAVIVKSDFVVNSEIVALTGDGHVVVAVHP